MPEKLAAGKEFLGLNSFGKKSAAAAQVGDLRRERLSKNWRGSNQRQSFEQLDVKRGNHFKKHSGEKSSKQRQRVLVDANSRGKHLQIQRQSVDAKKRGKHVYIITKHT